MNQGDKPKCKVVVRDFEGKRGARIHPKGCRVAKRVMAPGGAVRKVDKRGRLKADKLKVKVTDRTGIILEVFARRAKSNEGKMQVQLAELIYRKSRLVRAWTHLERQRGGTTFIGGPGELQIELDPTLGLKNLD